MLTSQPVDDSDSSSDYGPDFTSDEEALINELLAKVATEHPPPPPSHLPSLTPVRDIEDYDPHPRLRSPKILGREKSSPLRPPPLPAASNAVPIDRSPPTTKHPSSIEGRERDRERQIAREAEWTRPSPSPSSSQTDTRSPIERFRKPPNKAFSVTDLISPAWCELQYWYALTKYGRKRRTAAMKQGSSIHKTLEDEIHTTVPVEVNTKEDAWALRIWNVIQGLRTLREFGTTRELEVWGVVDGEVVNGIIDQLGYESSDPEMEMQAEGFYNEIERSRSMLPEYQMSLTDYLLSEAQGGKRLGEVWEGGEGEGKGEKGKEIEDEPAAHTGNDVYSIPRIYLTDVKTRGSRSVPTVKSSPFRPTLLQLQLYFHLLTRMVVSDDISISVLADRYDLDPTRRFTDGFIAEVGGLNGQFFDALDSRTFDPDYIPTPDEASRHSPSHDPSSPSSPPPSSSQDSTSILLEHNTLTSLWSLMKHQLRLTFLLPAQETAGVAPSIPAEKQPEVLNEYRTLLSPLLTARFISATAGADSSKRVLGSRSFLFDPTSLSTHLADQMEWWRGERDPRGVEVVEAWKCRLCEFSEGCSWRQEKEWSLAGRKRRSRGSA